MADQVCLWHTVLKYSQATAAGVCILRTQEWSRGQALPVTWVPLGLSEYKIPTSCSLRMNSLASGLIATDVFLQTLENLLCIFPFQSYTVRKAQPDFMLNLRISLILINTARRTQIYSKESCTYFPTSFSPSTNTPLLLFHLLPLPVILWFLCLSSHVQMFCYFNFFFYFFLPCLVLHKTQNSFLLRQLLC